MPRKPRVRFEGGIYHVFSRGNGGKDVFRDGSDYRYFLATLSELARTRELRCLAYCQMPNHFHLLLMMGTIDISVLMQAALGRYAQYFNFHHSTYGHVFQGRFNERLCTTDSYLVELVRYIHMNPVRGGLVERPEDWHWSSHRTLAFGSANPLINDIDLLRYFGPDSVSARAEYRGFIAVETDWTPDEPPSDVVPQFADSAIAPQLPAPRLIDLASSVAQRWSVSLDAICGETQQRSITQARHALILESWQKGINRADVAQFLKCTPEAITKVISRKGRTVPICPSVRV